jgi:hypothetical protein
MHWYDAVNQIRARKLELAAIDPRGGMPVMPACRAGERGIAAVERRLRRPLPPSYRAFLAVHDGWSQFYQGASLLGVRQLARGTYDEVTRLVMEEWDAPRHGSARAPRRQVPKHMLVPFGIDARAETIFAFDTNSPSADGELEIVVWLNEIGERVESFPRFLELVLDLLGADMEERRQRVADARNGAARPPVSAGFAARAEPERWPSARRASFA